MAERMVQQTLDGAATTSRKRNSYSREEKLCVITWYGENGKNLYQMCKHFALNSKTLIRWIADIRAPNIFVDMMPMNHALVRVIFQVFLAFCHSMPL